MKITVVTPLFPPDIGDPAPYVKELIGRLHDHEVTLVCYGHLPEQVEHVTYHTVDKRNHVFVRAWNMTKALYALSHDTDVFYVQNGVSVEIPMILISFLKRVRILYAMSDQRARKKCQQKFLCRRITTRMQRRAYNTIDLDQSNYNSTTLTRPETLPFAPPPAQAYQQFERSWDQHLTELNTHFTYVHR